MARTICRSDTGSHKHANVRMHIELLTAIEMPEMLSPDWCTIGSITFECEKMVFELERVVSRLTLSDSMRQCPQRLGKQWEHCHYSVVSENSYADGALSKQEILAFVKFSSLSSLSRTGVSMHRRSAHGCT